MYQNMKTNIANGMASCVFSLSDSLPFISSILQLDPEKWNGTSELQSSGSAQGRSVKLQLVRPGQPYTKRERDSLTAHS